MAKIRSAEIELAPFSKHRTKKSGMSEKALYAAFEAGEHFTAHNIDGVPVNTYCSCRDFKDGATVSIVEVVNGFYETKCYFTYAAKVEEHDIPHFMTGAPVELD